MSGIHEGPVTQPYSATCYKTPIANDINSTGMISTDSPAITITIDKTVLSLCPVCLKVTPAHIFPESGKVFMEK